MRQETFNLQVSPASVGQTVSDTLTGNTFFQTVWMKCAGQKSKTNLHSAQFHK